MTFAKTHRINFSLLPLLFTLFTVINTAAASNSLPQNKVALEVDYARFLSNHDLIWDEIPHRWESAPFLGNGVIGFMLYQDIRKNPKTSANQLRLDIGRGDYYDHRPVSKDPRDTWTNVGRLPIGHFTLSSRGKITKMNLRLNLWQAEISGTIETDKGHYTLTGLVDSNSDNIFLDISSSADEKITINWHPDKAYSSARNIAKGIIKKSVAKDKKYSPLFKHLANIDYPDAPEVVLGTKQNIHYSYQGLLNKQGETTVAWTVESTVESKGQKTRLLASIHHSYPAANSLELAIRNIKHARGKLAQGSLISEHRQWWHGYYKKSFLSLNDKRVEGFYWIQMYKFASATRGDSSILDLMGPWYQKTIWPLIWADLNVQLTYWTTLTANRLEVAESLPNNIDKYQTNLFKNVHPDWQGDSTNIGTIFPANMLAPAGKKVPDILLWVLHNYWLYCQYAGDEQRLAEKFFPLLKSTVNTYLHYLAENKLDLGDGKIHIKYSWSPEYPAGRGVDTNFSLSLLRWATQTLLAIDKKNNFNDAKKAEWQNIVDNLADYPVDENGLRIGRDIAFAKSHRHYSHLLGFYPLYLFDPFDKAEKALLSTTLDHWLATAQDPDKVVDLAMPVTGYTATGAASMYASLHDADKAYHYLYSLLNHERISSTTMYSEGSPVIESPLSFATSVHDMVLQSWGGKIQVFPAIPSQWPDIEFYHLRTQGAFLVSAKKHKGVTQFIEIESLAGTELIIKTDILSAKYTINGSPVEVVKLANGFVKIPLKKGHSVQLLRTNYSQKNLIIDGVKNLNSQRNIYGLNKRSSHIPGYNYYQRQSKN